MGCLIQIPRMIYESEWDFTVIPSIKTFYLKHSKQFHYQNSRVADNENALIWHAKLFFIANSAIRTVLPTESGYPLNHMTNDSHFNHEYNAPKSLPFPQNTALPESLSNWLIPSCISIYLCRANVKHKVRLLL